MWLVEKAVSQLGSWARVNHLSGLMAVSWKLHFSREAWSGKAGTAQCGQVDRQKEVSHLHRSEAGRGPRRLPGTPQKGVGLPALLPALYPCPLPASFLLSQFLAPIPTSFLTPDHK